MVAYKLGNSSFFFINHLSKIYKKTKRQNKKLDIQKINNTTKNEETVLNRVFNRGNASVWETPKNVLCP